jgi:trehalose 6-phosphate synthase
MDLINPYDINGMKATMMRAYHAEPKEVTRRMRCDAQAGERDRTWPSGPATFLESLSLAGATHHDKTTRPALKT